VNRPGFVLLTLGSILAFLGWHYREDTFAALGFLLLIYLTVFAAIMPTSISYKPEAEVQPLARPARWLWGLYYAFALAMGIAGLAHTMAGGRGEYVLVAGLGLFVSLALYDAFHLARFRAWRLERLRALRSGDGR
jgi:hypothetical protein